jgi:hypothetical protein
MKPLVETLILKFTEFELLIAFFMIANNFFPTRAPFSLAICKRQLAFKRPGSQLPSFLVLASWLPS